MTKKSSHILLLFRTLVYTVVFFLGSALVLPLTFMFIAGQLGLNSHLEWLLYPIFLLTLIPAFICSFIYTPICMYDILRKTTDARQPFWSPQKAEKKVFKILGISSIFWTAFLINIHV